ncbi:hypothetical protein AVEN_272728-1 [Araneus ventricosus]|uniref:Uncharacterized protein n=1 Tax=Araneus ventricosus TaxID=182803 RepID=A0A4Y2RH99_ARAVE|nr:hypothetical protein AVEN_272728-1 [Araneus ventricosus]
MEKQHSFVLKVSLVEMALRRVVVHFWNEIDILALIDEFEFKEHSGFDFLYVLQETVEVKIKNKISKLIFPETLKRRLNLIVRPIGLQIVQWKNCMEQYIGDSGENLSLLKQLCWTSAGALAYKETAQNLVRLKTIDIVDSFIIACTYCLADSLPAIWEELPEEYTWHFCDNLLDTADEETLIYILKGEDTKVLERQPYFYLNSFEFSTRRGNKAATEYFLQKLFDEFPRL